MIITAIRVGKTFNTGNYTSHKVEIEAVPDNGQSFEDAIGQINALVDSQNTTEGATAPAKGTSAKSATAPPLKGKGKTTEAKVAEKKSDPTPAVAETQSTATPVASEEPPFTPGKDVAAEPAKPKAKRGRPRKTSEVPGVDDLLKLVPDCVSVTALLAVFNDMRSVADRTAGEHADAWEQVCKQVAAHLRSLPGQAESESYPAIVAAFDSERNALATTRGENK